MKRYSIHHSYLITFNALTIKQVSFRIVCVVLCCWRCKIVALDLFLFVFAWQNKFKKTFKTTSRRLNCCYPQMITCLNFPCIIISVLSSFMVGSNWIYHSNLIVWLMDRTNVLVLYTFAIWLYGRRKNTKVKSYIKIFVLCKLKFLLTAFKENFLLNLK